MKSKFVKPKDLSVIENENAYILKKGFLHINEVIINKKESSEDFIKAFGEFVETGYLLVNDTTKVHEDFNQLLQFGLVNIESNKKIIVIINEELKSYSENYLNEKIEYKTIYEIMSLEDIIKINESKDNIKIKSIYDKYSTCFKDYDNVYYLDNFKNISDLRAINRLTATLNLELTLGFYDNDNVYFTKIKHKYTGCFECLERHIISKFPEDINYYIKNTNDIINCVTSKSEILFLFSLLLKDIQNVEIYGSSSLTGHLIHFNLTSFEYSYNTNRRYVSCPNCASINNANFQEQNIRSVNMIKEALSSD